MSEQRLTNELIADPQLYRLGLMIDDRGMEVTLTSLVSDAPLTYRRVDYAPMSASTAPVRKLEEAVYDNPLLTADFGAVDVLIDTPRFFLLPGSEADAEHVEAARELLYADADVEPVVTAVDNDRVAVVGMADRDVMKFVGRTFNNAPVMHRMASLARYYSLRNHLGNSGKLHVRLGEGRTDVLALSHSGLMMANTFETPTIDDAVYYALAVANHLGFDNETDRVLAGGERGRRDAFVAAMRRYVTFVMPEIVPASISALGALSQQAPFELLSLPLSR